MLSVNPAYRCIEATAHGMFSWQRQDLLATLAAAAAVGVALQNVIFAAVAGVVGLAAITLGRRSWQGRRDYLLLLIRRLERRRVYRSLDPDRAYVPFGSSE